MSVRGVVAGLAVAAALLAPPDASGRMIAQPGETCDTRQFVEMAGRLSGMADSVLRVSGDWDRAARLLVESAELRPVCDPERSASLREAARWFRFAGAERSASEVLLRAAEERVWSGDVVQAASTYLEAATWAFEAGAGTSAREALEHARLLTSSPLISEAQRLRLRGQIDNLVNTAASG